MNKETFEMMNRPVSEIMTKKIIAVLPTDNLQIVNDIFKKHNINHIPVVRHKDMVGFISKTDFNKVIHVSILENVDSHNEYLFSIFKAEDIMTKSIVKISPNDKVGTAAEIFLENYFHALPIVNDDNELVGIVSSYDIIKMFFHEAYPNQEPNQIF